MTSARSIPHLNPLPGVIFCALAVVCTSSAQVLEPCELAILTASDATPGGGVSFGGPVAISGDYLVVGAALDTNIGPEDGAVYVFRRDGINWVEQAKLLHPNPSGADVFAGAVAIDGDRIVVGAPHNTFNTSGLGSAHVFRRQSGTWRFEQTLVSSGSRDFDWFGLSVSISGQLVAVGAPEQDLGGGDAYLFQRQGGTWVEVAAFTGTDTEAHDLFGISVSLDGDLLAIGASADPDAGDRAGAAYIFRRDGEIGWVQEAKLVASDANPVDRFGCAVLLHEGFVLVGACHSDDAGPSSGSVYVFVQKNVAWIEQAKLTPANALNLAEFGSSLAAEGDLLIVGAPGDHEGGFPAAGAIHLFRQDKSGWTEIDKLLASAPNSGDFFGSSVSVSDNYLLIAKRREVHVYAVAGDCNGNGVTDSCEILDGTATDVNRSGIPDSCENIPAVSRWGLFVLTLLLAVAGTVCLQRRGRSPLDRKDEGVRGLRCLLGIVVVCYSVEYWLPSGGWEHA